MNQKTRIAVTGPLGRMGQMLIKEIQSNKNTLLTASLVKKNHPLLNQDIGEKIGIGKIGVLISDTIDIKKNNFDVLIDFTKPCSTLKYLKYCNKFKKNIVIGTTGFSDSEIDVVHHNSKKIAIMMASNFSIGVNLLFELIKKTTQVIGHHADIDIIEYHHRNKIDAPSGTALEMGKIISNVMHWNLNEHSVYYNKGMTGARNNNKIGFSIIRAGNIIGKHTAMFSNLSEEIKITHTAFNRSCFAEGAVKSAQWLHKKKSGLFNIKDILSI